MLTQRKIFWFWLPLAASWALMVLQGTIIQGAIARLPHAELMLAASGIVISLAVTIESPVIMLLATSTALASSAQAYRVLHRFVLHLTVGLTLVAVAIAFVNPVYNWLVPGLMGIPDNIALAAQPALKVMVFWTAAIGWRRFYQGILIRYNRTRQVGYGTVVRLIAIGLTAIGLSTRSQLPGVMVAGFAWMSGVLAEMIYVYFATRPVVAKHLSGPDTPTQSPLTYRQVVRYHAPLAATSLLALLAQPLIGAGLARMESPQANLAAWTVIFTILLFFRSFAFALPETIIALLKTPSDFLPLRKFSWMVAGGGTLAMALFVFTPLIGVYLLGIIRVSPELIVFILPGVIAGLLIPALHTGQSWFRGLLLEAKETDNIYWGMGVNLIFTALVLGIGVLLQAPGAPTAAIALSIGMVAEIVYLKWRVGDNN